MPQVKPGLSSLMRDGKAAAAQDADLHALPDIQLRTAAQQAAASLQVFFFLSRSLQVFFFKKPPLAP
jgi:hypothetical protein